VLHSSRHNRGLDHKGKKVVVVGACTSGVYPFPTSLSKTCSNRCVAHDIAMDYYEHGVGVSFVFTFFTIS
jgi:hypothetical protein